MGLEWVNFVEMSLAAKKIGVIYNFCHTMDDFSKIFIIFSALVFRWGKKGVKLSLW